MLDARTKTQTLRVTIFKNEKALSLEAKDLTLEELRTLILKTSAPSKAALPWLKLATFGTKRTAKKCLRNNANVKMMTGIEVEHDEGKISYDETIAILKKANLHALIYTSPSYTAAEPKWRILCPLSQPLAPDGNLAKHPFVARLNGLFGGTLCKASWTLSQAFYYGSVNNPEHRVQIIPGEYIDQRPDLDAGAVAKDKKPEAKTKERQEYDDGIDDEDVNMWPMFIQQINTGNYHDALMRLAASLIGKKTPRTAAGDMLRGLMDASPAPHDDRWQDRYDDIDRTVETAFRKFVAPTDAVSEENGVICAADIEMRSLNWIWPGHLLRGALELLAGIPGLGKSQVHNSYVASATNKVPWPDDTITEPVNVIMLTAEDGLEDTLKPRLIAAGADLKRVHILKFIRIDKETQRAFLLTEDLERLERIAQKIGNVGLITIDPITAYMGGKLDSHKSTDVRSQLSPLKDFAERTKIAISAITHPPKNASPKAIDHFIGSQAFIAAARIGHVCAEEIKEEDGEKKPTGRILFTNAKNNPVKKQKTFAYHIGSKIIGVDPNNNLDIEAPLVMWEGEVNITADAALSAAHGNKPRGETMEVQKWLRTILNVSEPVPFKQILAAAEELGYSKKQIRIAARHLSVIMTKAGFPAEGMWTLPDTM